MANTKTKAEALQDLKARLERLFGEVEIRKEVMNEIFDAGAWFGAEFVTGEIERRAIERKGAIPPIDPSKLS